MILDFLHRYFNCNAHFQLSHISLVMFVLVAKVYTLFHSICSFVSPSARAIRLPQALCSISLVALDSLSSLSLTSSTHFHICLTNWSPAYGLKFKLTYTTHLTPEYLYVPAPTHACFHRLLTLLLFPTSWCSNFGETFWPLIELCRFISFLCIQF